MLGRPNGHHHCQVMDAAVSKPGGRPVCEMGPVAPEVLDKLHHVDPSAVFTLAVAWLPLPFLKPTCLGTGRLQFVTLAV